MAKSTEIHLQAFNLELALSGASIACSESGLSSGKVGKFVTDFKVAEKPLPYYVYEGYIGATKLYYNKLGECSTGNAKDNLFIVTATETISTDNVATKGDSDGSISDIKINSLNPREEFAKVAMASLIQSVDDPLSMDTVKVVQIAEMSFKIAQSMLNSAADYRSTFEDDSSENIDVKPTDVSSTTDKILFNLTEQIKKYNETATIIKDEIVTMDDSVKTIATSSDSIQRVDIASVSLGSIDTNVTNTSDNPVKVKSV